MVWGCVTLAGTNWLKNSKYSLDLAIWAGFISSVRGVWGIGVKNLYFPFGAGKLHRFDFFSRPKRFGTQNAQNDIVLETLSHQEINRIVS